MLSLTGAILAGALLTAGDWELRYHNFGDQLPEWTAAGYVPAWDVTWVDRERPEVTWTEEGPCRGYLMFGRRLEVDATELARVDLRLSYYTTCGMDDPENQRSGLLHGFVMTEAAWESLASEPAAAAITDLRRLPGMLAWVNIQGQGPDVPDWREGVEVPLLTAPGVLRDAGPVVAGVAWGCAHYHVPETGGLRDCEVITVTAAQARWEFWRALDLDLPELAAVRAAVEAEDEPAAEAALAAHLRRDRPGQPDAAIGPGREAVVRRADETLAGTYRLAGCPPYTFTGPVVWNADPFNYNQWPVALNRHFEWNLLASAWLATDNPVYPEAWNNQVVHWVDSMPVHIAPSWIQGPFNQQGLVSLSLDAGIRMGQTWFQSFAVFHQNPAVTDEALVKFARSVWQHGRYLMLPENFRSGSNWGAMEANGLYHIGVLMPEFREAALWRETAMTRTVAELDLQVYPDGAQIELAPSYHGVSLLNFLGVLELARANAIEVPAELETKLERMFDYWLKIAQPDLRVPALNDSGTGHIGATLWRGYKLFGHREDFRWAGTNRAEGTPPAETSLVLPWAGYVIFRSGWAPEDSWLLFDAGPFGTAHQHEDKLGLLLTVAGHRLLIEGGNYAYDTSKWREYILSTRSHNTVRVNGQDQACRFDRREHRATAPNTYGFRDEPAFAYARDTHTAGYGPREAISRAVTHRRRVLWLKPDLYLVVDDLAANDEAEHTATAQFLLNAPAATLAPETLAVVGEPPAEGAPRLAVLPLATANLTARIAQGEEEPEVLGFVPRGFEQLRPVPAGLFTRTFTSAATVAWLLVPFQGEACPVTPVATADGATITASFTTLDGQAATLTISPTELRATVGDQTFTATEPPLAAGPAAGPAAE